MVELLTLGACGFFLAFSAFSLKRSIFKYVVFNSAGTNLLMFGLLGLYSSVPFFEFSRLLWTCGEQPAAVVNIRSA